MYDNFWITNQSVKFNTIFPLMCIAHKWMNPIIMQILSAELSTRSWLCPMKSRDSSLYTYIHVHCKIVHTVLISIPIVSRVILKESIYNLHPVSILGSTVGIYSNAFLLHCMVHLQWKITNMHWINYGVYLNTVKLDVKQDNQCKKWRCLCKS